MPWDSSCEPPNGYKWTDGFLDELRFSGFVETTQSPLEPITGYKEETDSDIEFP